MINFADYKDKIESILGKYNVADGIGQQVEFTNGHIGPLMCSEEDWNKKVIPELDKLASQYAIEFQRETNNCGWIKPYVQSGETAYVLDLNQEPKTRLHSLLIILCAWLGWQFKPCPDDRFNDETWFSRLQKARETGRNW